MTDRERLIELLASPTPIVEGGNTVGEKRLSYFLAENIADKLLANGVTLPPVTVGQKVYQSDGVKVYESTVRKVIYETENVAFDEDAIGRSIFLSAAEAKGEKKLTYEEFLTEGKFVAGHRYSEEDLRAMYEAYLDDGATE